MFKKSNGAICISLSDGVLKIVQLKGAGASAQVTQVFAQNIKDVDAAQISSSITTALKSFNTKDLDIINVISPSTTTTKNIEIPSTSTEEIKSIVDLQAGRHTPFSREEIQIGYVNNGVFKDNYTKVLLVIANKGILKDQLDILSQAGLQSKNVSFAPEGTSKLYSDFLGCAKDEAPVGIIDVGAQSTDVIIALKGVPITCRTINVGRAQLGSDQAKLVDEIKKTVDAYQSEDISGSPSKFVLTNDDSLTQSLGTALTEKLQAQVEVVSYVDRLKVSDSALQALGSQYGEYSFLDVIAAGANRDKSQINLLPEEFELQKTVEDQSKQVFQAASLVLIVIAIFAAGLGTRIYFNGSYLSKLKDNYSKNRSEVAKLESMSLSSLVIDGHLVSRTSTLDVLRELYSTLPDEIYISSLTMDEKGVISVSGISDVNSLIYNLATDLKESEVFKSVKIDSKTAKKDRGKDVSAFELSLTLHSSQEDLAMNETPAE